VTLLAFVDHRSFEIFHKLQRDEVFQLEIYPGNSLTVLAQNKLHFSI